MPVLPRLRRERLHRCCCGLGSGLRLGGLCPGLYQLSIGSLGCQHGPQRQLPLLLHLLPSAQHPLLLLQLIGGDGCCGGREPRPPRPRRGGPAAGPAAPCRPAVGRRMRRGRSGACRSCRQWLLGGQEQRQGGGAAAIPIWVQQRSCRTWVLSSWRCSKRAAACRLPALQERVCRLACCAGCTVGPHCCCALRG